MLTSILKNILSFIMPFTGIIFFTVILTAASVIDLKHRIIPDKLIITGFIFIVVHKIIYLILKASSCSFSSMDFPGSISIWDMISGLFAGSAPLLIVNIFNTLTSKPDKIKSNFGGGDIKLMALGGFYLGTRSVLASYFYTSVSTLAVLPVLLALRKIKRKDHIPFGPFLSFGLFLAMLSQVIPRG